MSQVCRQCSRVNPLDAAYCYYDGAALAGGGGPVHAASQTFPSQFVFPNGQVCRDFDQLALACHEQWPTALDMLKQGYLGAFFGGLGRADLAQAAVEAAGFPDSDRGLDQLLAKLPTGALQAPKLKVEPSVINLGQLKIGEDRHTELHLQNLGMRLLYGSAASDTKWILLGEPPGAPEKVFQFGSETTFAVQIRGQHLRAGIKPLEGHVVVESNGGTATITLRADIPVSPFPQEGIFQGALTPREIAEKAKASPKAAAPFFESGAVARWFTSNGWIYPVQGPTAPGVGGVQQFFEALGLAKAPRLEIDTQKITLKGDGGQTLHTAVEVTTPEKKVVYAYAVCDQPWVDCSKVTLAGRSATITVAVPRVPNRPGETLSARVTVHGNGNQKFVVPLSLTVGGTDPSAPSAPSEAMPAPAAPLVEPPAVIRPSVFAFGADAPASAESAPPPSAEAAVPLVVTASLPRPAPERAAGAPKALWFHLTPLAALGVALLCVLFYDMLGSGSPAVRPGETLDPTPRLDLKFDYTETPDKNIGNSMMFGLATLNPADRTLDKYLTYDLRGRTNSAVALIDGQERPFGSIKAGKWLARPKTHGAFGRSAGFLYGSEQIVVTQTVDIIHGESFEVAPEAYKRLLDTCLVRYSLRNQDQRPHTVGFRFLLDTLIGNNDGCPFTVPGSATLVSTAEDFNPAKNSKPVPDFVQALEFEDLRRPGTIAQATFRLGERIEAPGRVSLTQWPGGDWLRRYELPVRPIGKDSAVVMYWHPAELAPGKTREIGFAYGLGNVAADEYASIGLTVGGSLVVKGELAVVALIANPQPGQSVTIDVPNGLTLLPSHPATQPVPAGTEKLPDGRLRASPVTWRLRAGAAGVYPVSVKTSDNLEASRRVTIKKSSIF